MGYKGYVEKDEISYFDLKSDVMGTIGKEIKLGFKSEFPEKEKKYILKNAIVGRDVKGGYIHFYLADSDEGDLEFIITGIKDYEYEIYDHHRKYSVSVSDDILQTPPELEPGQSYKLQTGEETYRFFLYIDKAIV